MTERHGPRRDHEHPLAGIVFLLVVAGLVFLGARAGIQSSKHAKLKAEMREAVEAGARGEYDQAESSLRSIAHDHPDDVDALFNLGIAELALEHEDDAYATFERVLTLSPKDYDALAEQAVIHKHKGNRDKALAMLESIPAGEGHVRERLVHEAAWDDLAGTPRMNALREKHGLPAEELGEAAGTATTAVAGDRRP